MRQVQPAFHRLPVVAVEGNVEGVHQMQSLIDRLKAGSQGKLAHLGQCALPESIEIGGFLAFGTVDLQLVEGEIEEHGRKLLLLDVQA